MEKNKYNTYEDDNQVENYRKNKNDQNSRIIYPKSGKNLNIYVYVDDNENEKEKNLSKRIKKIRTETNTMQGRSNKYYTINNNEMYNRKENEKMQNIKMNERKKDQYQQKFNIKSNGDPTLIKRKKLYL